MATKKIIRKAVKAAPPPRKPQAPATRAVVKTPAKKAAAKRPAITRVVRAGKPVASATDIQREVEQFLYRQSELLDGRQWQAFIDLFTGDGLYWMPSLPTHTTWDGVPSILAEDRDMMTVRMKRVSHPNAWSQQAEWATNHVVSNVVIESVDPKTGDIQARSRFHMMELRRDDVRHFGGTYRHHLQRTADGLRIKLQRVDLFNAQAPYEYVLQVWV